MTRNTGENFRLPSLSREKREVYKANNGYIIHDRFFTIWLRQQPYRSKKHKYHHRKKMLQPLPQILFSSLTLRLHG